MRSVSMSPSEAPSVIAMKRVGEVFEQFKSDSAVMIVLEGDQPLADDAHRFYDELVDRLEADTKHVEHVQDFWGDPLTEAGAQSSDLKAGYVQVYLAGNMGEALSNEPVEAVNEIVAGLPAPPDRRRHRDGHVRRHHHDADAGLPVHRHRAHRAGDGVSRALGHARRGGVPRLPRADRLVDVRDESACHAGDRRDHRLRDLPDRPIPGSPHDRRMLEPKRAMRIRGWRKIGALIVRWPGPVLLGTVALSLVGLLTLPGYQPNYNDRNYLPPDLPANQGFAAAERHFSPATMNPKLLLLQSDHDLRNSADFLVIDKIAKAVFRVPGIGRVQTITRPSRQTH